MMLFSLFMGWVFERAHMVMCARNYGSLYNGYGAIELVNAREAKAPMAYRVLIPWLVRWIEHAPISRITIYETLKTLAIAYSFYAVWQWLGLTGALLTFVIILLTVEFDYWDWAFEIAGIALAMSAPWWVVCIGVVLYAASRETWPLAAAAYAMATHDYFGTVALLIAGFMVGAAIRSYVGKKSLYCKRFMIRENIALVKKAARYQPFFQSQIFISLVLTILIIGAAVTLPTGWLIPLVLLGAGWTMAKADEPRVFTAAIPWVAALIAGAL